LRSGLVERNERPYSIHQINSLVMCVKIRCVAHVYYIYMYYYVFLLPSISNMYVTHFHACFYL